MVAYGAEDTFEPLLRELGQGLDGCVLLMNLASTPEIENHGRVLDAARDRARDATVAGPCRLLVDEAYCDLTGTERHYGGDLLKAGQQFKNRIRREIGLTARWPWVVAFTFGLRGSIRISNDEVAQIRRLVFFLHRRLVCRKRQYIRRRVDAPVLPVEISHNVLQG